MTLEDAADSEVGAGGSADGQAPKRIRPGCNAAANERGSRLSQLTPLARFQGVELYGPCPRRRDLGGGVRRGGSSDGRPTTTRSSCGNYAGRSVLLPGDIGSPAAGAAESQCGRQPRRSALRSMLKAPHHCSQTSSSESFVAAVQPRRVICPFACLTTAIVSARGRLPPLSGRRQPGAAYRRRWRGGAAASTHAGRLRL